MTRNATNTISELARRGVTVTIKGGNLDLKYVESAPLPPELIESIREHKPSLVSYFWRGPRPERCGWCGDTSLSPRADGRAWCCDTCHPIWESKEVNR